MVVKITDTWQPERAREEYEKGNVAQIVMTINECGRSRILNKFYYYNIYVIDKEGTWHVVAPIEYVPKKGYTVRREWKPVYSMGKGWYYLVYGLDRRLALLAMIFGESIYDYSNNRRKAEIVYLWTG